MFVCSTAACSEGGRSSGGKKSYDLTFCLLDKLVTKVTQSCKMWTSFALLRSEETLMLCIVILFAATPVRRAALASGIVNGSGIAPLQDGNHTTLEYTNTFLKLPLFYSRLSRLSHRSLQHVSPGIFRSCMSNPDVCVMV